MNTKQAEPTQGVTMTQNEYFKLVHECEAAKWDRDALLAALKALVRFEDEYYPPMPHTGGGIALKDAKAAIAQAEGRAE